MSRKLNWQRVMRVPGHRPRGANHVPASGQRVNDGNGRCRSIQTSGELGWGLAACPPAMMRPAAEDARFEREALSCLPEVGRFALSLNRDQTEADDLVQDTYLQAYQSWHQYRGRS